MPVSDYDSLVKEAADEWNVDPHLLRSVMQQESGGKRTDAQGRPIRSTAGAGGVMQIMPQTAERLGVKNVDDPAQAIFGAAKYLNTLLDRYKDKPNPAALAAAAYNAGEQRVDDWLAGKGTLPAETQKYIPAVAAHYQKFSGATPKAAAAVAPAASSTPSEADFLKSVGAVAEASGAAPGANADADFLKSVGAVEPKLMTLEPADIYQGTAGSIPNEGAAERVIGGAAKAVGDVVGSAKGAVPQPKVQLDPERAAVGQGILDRIGGAAAEAWRETPNPLMTPQFRETIERGGPVGRYFTSPLLQVGGTALRGLAALGASGMAGVAEAANAAGVPALGRDINILSQTAPMVMAGAPATAGWMRPSTNPLAVGGGADTLAVEKPRISVRADMRGPENPLAGPEGMPFRMPESEPTIPRSVGAAASREQTPQREIDISPKQEMAYRATAEGQKLIEPQQPGIRDATVYVPDVNPNAAEVEQTVNTARELKALNMTSEAVSQEARQIAADHNDARQRFFAQTARSDVDVHNAKEVRSEMAERDLAATWANKTAANPEPLLQLADEIKASPDGRRPVVRNAVDGVVKELFDKDGNLITDPEQLYGIRKHVDDLIEEKDGAGSKKNVRAEANLLSLKAKLDEVIEAAAPGFGQYLQNFADASRAIDEMEILQKHESKLYDAQNRMSYAKVQAMMKNIVDSRQAPGVNKYKSISDETMERLWRLRDDLRRSASALELARVPGDSGTAQNVMDVLKDAAKHGANALAHAGAFSQAGILGNVALYAGKNALMGQMEKRAAQKRMTRGLELLRPDPQKPGNPLAGP